MTTDGSEVSKRSYGCSFGDGNPYDYIMVDAQSGDTLFVCVPCFIRQAMDMATAFINSDDPNVRAIVEMMEQAQGEPVPGPAGRKRGHNAPAGEFGEELFDHYEDRVLPDELPPEFR